jgi:selenide, water dikinase
MSVPIRLTEFAHGSGCGCKLAPSVLTQLLATVPQVAGFPQLLVGAETADDAAVYQVSDRLAIVATTDFFMPIVDDPFDFGRIAATNALADIYAMGGKPIFALAVVGMPIDRLPIEVIRRILEGGASVCAEAGIPIAGGHSIDAPEPIYGLVAIGTVDPARLLRNSTAQAGDRLILTKRLGIGIFSAALKRRELDDQSYAEMLASTTQLNDLGAWLPDIRGVHSVTDVTGFGLLGHTLEMCRGSSLGAVLMWEALPMLPTAREMAQAGIGTGAAKRNWASYGAEVDLGPALPDWARDILCDPQTSGGLLIACAPAAVEEVLALSRRHGFMHASAVGEFVAGPARVQV